MELIADFAYPLPVAVFCEMLGIPEEAGPRFRAWTAAVARSLDLVIDEADYDACIVLLNEMQQYLRDAAEAKRRAPGDDVLTELVEAESGGDRLTEPELVAQLVTLYVAGHEPTTALIGNGMTALLDNPEQLALLQAQPELIPHAVLELLRYDGPTSSSAGWRPGRWRSATGRRRPATCSTSASGPPTTTRPSGATPPRST